VVFVTDGDPTAEGRLNSTRTSLPDGSVEALQPAWEEANLVKGQGSHIFAVGVGPAVDLETSRRRLAAVTGYNEYPGVDFSRADYTVESDFDELQRALGRIVTELCRNSVTITKVVDQATASPKRTRDGGSPALSR
jgi:hypothetical protein